MEVWVRGPWCDGVGLKVARRKVRNETLEPVSRFGCLRVSSIRETRLCSVLQVLAAERRADSSIDWWRIGVLALSS
jgi:hypothetical protein